MQLGGVVSDGVVEVFGPLTLALSHEGRGNEESIRQ